ncbi:MAG TPA: hypothetical protein VEA99_04435 [Gemmatimonadaceae bacterium]|nr:hypothetical protein [Gemmatimonadaceae bacterium]
MSPRVLVTYLCIGLTLTAPSARAQSSAGAGCPTSGGGGTMVGAVDLVYALEGDSAGLRVAAAVLVRAPESWRRRPPPADGPALPGRLATSAHVGATVGPMFVGFEYDSRVVWAGRDPLPLGSANVALVVIDDAGRPRLEGTARVDPLLPLDSPGCRLPTTAEESRVFEAALVEVVRRAGAARDFLDAPRSHR